MAFWTGYMDAFAHLVGEQKTKALRMRVTEIFRKENVKWKLVHRQEDMLTCLRSVSVSAIEGWTATERAARYQELPDDLYAVLRAQKSSVKTALSTVKQLQATGVPMAKARHYE